MTNKYGNVKVSEDGYEFDSKAEHARYQELRVLESAGIISDLKVHPKYELLPTVYRDDRTVLFRKCHYTLDFSYRDKETQRLVCEEVKGFITPAWRLKIRLFLLRYGDQVDFNFIDASSLSRHSHSWVRSRA